MNTNPHHDLHPDSESLSAFAEHQLPEHERQPILAHLATCAQCRQILFLTQDAAEQEQPATASPILLLQPRKPLANWRYACVALAACAALATLSIVLYPHHPAATPEQAKAAAPQQIPAKHVAAPRAEGKEPLSQPLAPNRQSSPALKIVPQFEMSLKSGTLAQPAAPATAAKPAAQQPEPQKQADAAPSTTLNITLKPAQASETVEVQAAEAHLAQSANATVTVATDNAQLQPATPPLSVTMNTQALEPTSQIKLKSRNVQSLGSAPKSAAASGGAGKGSVLSEANVGPVASAAADSKSLAAFAKSAPRPLTISPEDETAAHNALGKILPAGLPAAATAAASHHLLAIDSAGSLFLSEDAGAVWEPVSTQWTGRAVVLLAPQTAPDQAGGSAIVGNATTDQPSPSPAALFEIVNDRGVHWTSPDGRVWKAK